MVNRKGTLWGARVPLAAAPAVGRALLLSAALATTLGPQPGDARGPAGASERAPSPGAWVGGPPPDAMVGASSPGAWVGAPPPDAIVPVPLLAPAATVVFAAPPGDSPGGDGSFARPFRNLQHAVEAAASGGTVCLMPGRFRLRPVSYPDSTCANCQHPDTLIQATRALRVWGRGVHLVGAGAGRTVLETRAGYGVLCERCEGCAIESLTVTGGARDTSGAASDAAVVVKGGRVRLEALELADNLGDSATVRRTVVGIMGVTGRDGAQLTVTGCRIVRNSWDGVALYRRAQAVITDNWIDGVDRAVGGRHGGGRGVGIGVTWDARAQVRGNAVRRYWKGIGAFVDAQVVAEENVVEEIATWGMTLWDADRGRPHATFAHNAVYRTGACGISVWRGDSVPPAPGSLAGNALVETGGNPKYDAGDVYCSQRALALDRLPQALRVADNLLFANREPGGNPGAGDLDSVAFVARVRPLVERLARRPALRETEFMRRFGGEAGAERR